MDPGRVSITNRFVYIFGFSAEVTLEGLQDLTEIPEVISINKDRILHPHLAQGIPLMNATTVRNSYNGAAIAIAICDTGIDYTHPRLGGGGFPNLKVLGGWDTGQNDSNPMDGNGHGTACAGIAAGDLGTVGDYIGGVAYNAKLYALKMTYTSTDGSAYTSDMVEAWEWCVTHQNDNPSYPIMIISTSFGGGYYTSTCDTAVPAMTTAASNAVAAGITIFVSSGNSGFCDGMGWPACITHVNSVGAVYDANIGARYGWCIRPESCIDYYEPGCAFAGYSYACDNPTTAADLVTCYSNTASFLNLLAPSNDTYTLGLGTGYNTTFGGTSAACPYAAGTAAVLQSAAKSIKGSYLTPAQVKSTLADTGDLVTDTKPTSDITKPRVNLGNAANTLGPQLSVTPGDGLTSSGNQGGPFSPSSKSYTLQNTGDSSINWKASKGQVWVSLSSMSGTLAAGANKTVTVSINSNANSLAPGSYSDTVSFTNTTNGNGNTTRPVSLTVKALPLPVVTIRATDSTATETGPTTGTFTVTRKGSTSGSLTVYYTTSGTAKPDNDYHALPGSVTIPVGSATATITVTPINDTLVEGRETVIVTLSSNSAYKLGVSKSATVRIISDDR